MSRYPAMSQAPVTYDRSLLVGAPAITREDRQAGYDINALEQGAYPQPSMAAPTTTMGQPAASAPDAADPFQDGYYDRTFSPSPATPSPTKRPWWRRKRWVALALIIVIGIICGIVAGVVTARNSRNTPALVTNLQQGAVSGPLESSTDSSISRPGQSLTSADDIVTRTTARPAAETPATATIPRGGGAGTTLYFGSTMPAGITLPTATLGPEPELGGEIPLICYVTPTTRYCSPYFEDQDDR